MARQNGPSSTRIHNRLSNATTDMAPRIADDGVRVAEKGLPDQRRLYPHGDRLSIARTVFMFSIQASLPLVAFSAALLLCFVFSIIRRKTLAARLEKRLSHAKPIAAVLCVPAGFLLMEIPYNPSLSAMEAKFVFLGLCVTGALFAIVYFLGQRSKTSMIAFLSACFASGVANYYVSSFKGQPILPSDIMALKTAAAVSGGYTYAIGNSVLIAFCIAVAMIALVVLLPKSTRTPRKMAANTGLGLALLAAFCIWFNVSDIEKDYECTVDVWSSLDSYQQHGSLLCFLERSQLLTPHAPEGYTPEEAERIRSEKAAAALAAETIDEGQATAPDVKPAIVVVMNETFSDLSRYPNVAQSYAGPSYFNSIDDAIAKGDCYVSAMGGGTCNSEFEYLTGSSMGLLGAGVYPYMLYDLKGADNMARYLSSLGYKTSAIHPAESENWRRDRVYKQLGFDEFHSIESFTDAETFRGMVSDASTYDLVLELLEQDEGPQFIFDVTIASHGGYDTGTIAEEEMARVPLDGEENAELNEYISCINRSDAELKDFMDKLRLLDRPVVLCFFGDHQPGFVEWLSNEAFEEDEMPEIELVQNRYVTPYMIWTNDAGLRKKTGTANTEPTSLNYLGAATLKSAGLPLDEYFAFLSAMKSEVPLINLNGYQDASGEWHHHGTSSESSASYAQLAMVEHNNLFEKGD